MSEMSENVLIQLRLTQSAAAEIRPAFAHVMEALEKSRPAMEAFAARIAEQTARIWKAQRGMAQWRS